MKPVLLLIFLAVLCFADDSKPVALLPLTKDEQAEAANAHAALQNALQQRAAAWSVILAADVTDCGKVTAAVSVAHSVEQNIQTAQAKSETALWKHRGAHGCQDCEYDEKLTALVRPKP